MINKLKAKMGRNSFHTHDKTISTLYMVVLLCLLIYTQKFISYLHSRIYKFSFFVKWNLCVCLSSRSLSHSVLCDLPFLVVVQPFISLITFGECLFSSIFFHLVEFLLLFLHLFLSLYRSLSFKLFLLPIFTWRVFIFPRLLLFHSFG